ncbi:hypothetical protein OSB04_024377 [Centaurea solstitialis]|uniref:Reverse transcriptase Ty1/copia-type domain-containing protein n=1 Tax=Centaurea solstitialis TaxID=347529 RepID=A0AA38WAA2_9ASTR|nr:hypothetical protein OSB04_024377 [Centaurea solstitialis]
MDVKSAFLNGVLHEEVYIEQPEGFVDPDFPDHVCILDKTLYGLKQAPRAWYDTLTNHLLSKGFKRGTIDTTLFLKKEGIQVKQNPNGIFINQSKYIKDMLKKFNMADCSPIKTPMPTGNLLGPDLAGKSVDQKIYRSMIGSLLYLTATRQDIMFSTCFCARFQANPKESHLAAVKRILRYLKGTPEVGLWYPKDSSFELISFTDSDYGGCKLDRKSTSGSCQFLGDKLVSWTSKKQNCVSTSTAEAEYVAATSCCSQVLWMKTQLLDYGYKLKRVPIYCDSENAIAITSNPVQHSKTKHIDIHYHFIKDNVEKGIPTDSCVVSGFSHLNLNLKRFGLLYGIDVISSVTYKCLITLDTLMPVTILHIILSSTPLLGVLCSPHQSMWDKALHIRVWITTLGMRPFGCMDSVQEQNHEGDLNWAQSGQYRVTGILGRYRWYQSQTRTNVHNGDIVSLR